MIVSINQYYEYFQNIIDKQRREPKLFNANNYNFDFSNVYDIFKRISDKIFDNIHKPQYLNFISIEEYLYLTVDCNLNIEKETGFPHRDIKSEIGRFRIFEIDKSQHEFPDGYEIMKLKRYYFESETLISIFVNPEMYSDDSSIVKFVYDIAELVTDSIIMKDNDIFTYYTKYDKAIVLDGLYNPSDAKFIVDYYDTIFDCVKFSLDKEMFKDYYSFNTNERPVVGILPDELMNMIYTHDDEYENICLEIYKYLKFN